VRSLELGGGFVAQAHAREQHGAVRSPRPEYASANAPADAAANTER
jgi:hypothetical protein